MPVLKPACASPVPSDSADFPVTRERGIVRLTPPLTAVVAQRAAAAVPQSALDQAAAWITAQITA
jgi:hypothetical protein